MRSALSRRPLCLDASSSLRTRCSEMDLATSYQGKRVRGLSCGNRRLQLRHQQNDASPHAMYFCTSLL
jgi:hypothetical protein